MTDAEQDPLDVANETGSSHMDEPADPLSTWVRAVALILGTGAIGAGGYAVFVSDNQAGTALLLVVGAVLSLLGLQGTPLRRFGSGEHSVELATIRRRLVQAADQATRDEPPAVAAVVADVVRAADPGAPIPPAWQTYESAVLQAIRRVAGQVRSDYQYGRGDQVVDARVEMPTGKVNVQIKYRSRGALGKRDLTQATAQIRAIGPEGGILLITNAPLSAEVRQDNLESSSEPGAVEVITWNDERDDDLLMRALARNAR